MNEVPTVHEAPSVSEHLTQADEAHNQALSNLGEVATHQPVVLATGEVQSEKDRQEELRVRAEQGHAYQR
jgi:hypothetical protein